MMTDATVLALTSNQSAWWITLLVGLIVAGVVWALLERLRRAVRDVEEAAAAAWAGGKQVERNTIMIYLLKSTRARGAELAEELDQHRGAERSKR